MVPNAPTTPQANGGQTLTATTPRELLSMTTTIILGKNLLADGYRVEEAGRAGFFVVHGPDEVGPRTGKVTHHGPYRVDVVGQTCSCPGFEHMNGVCKHLECATAVFYGVVATPFCEVLDDGLVVLASLDGSQYLVGADSMIYAFRSRDLATYRAKSAAKAFGPLQVLALDSSAIQAAMDDARYSGICLSMEGDFATIHFPAPDPIEDAWATWREDTAHALAGLGSGKAAEVRGHRFPKVGTPEYAAQLERDFS
jgi:hypothetical protein